jgi:hypothetical protein
MKINIKNYEKVVNEADNGKMVKIKLSNNDEFEYHYFMNDDEVHGYVVGIHDIVDAIDDLEIEFITVNDKIMEGDLTNMLRYIKNIKG